MLQYAQHECCCLNNPRPTQPLLFQEVLREHKDVSAFIHNGTLWDKLLYISIRKGNSILFSTDLTLFFQCFAETLLLHF